MSETLRVSDVLVREEIWQSWISMLRSYAALAGVEYTVTSLTDWAKVDYRDRFVRFCFDSSTGTGVWSAELKTGEFGMSEDGRVNFGKGPEELDMAAIRWIGWLAEP